MKPGKLITTEDTADSEAGSRRGFLLRVLGVLSGGALVSSCGYALAGRGAFLPSYIQRIGIPTFVNRTTVFNLETLITEKVRAEFIGRGKYTVTPADTGADALLTGEVLGISVVPVGITENQFASR